MPQSVEAQIDQGIGRQWRDRAAGVGHGGEYQMLHQHFVHRFGQGQQAVGVRQHRGFVRRHADALDVEQHLFAGRRAQHRGPAITRWAPGRYPPVVEGNWRVDAMCRCLAGRDIGGVAQQPAVDGGLLRNARDGFPGPVEVGADRWVVGEQHPGIGHSENLFFGQVLATAGVVGQLLHPRANGEGQVQVVLLLIKRSGTIHR
ncbi:hypothetical protein [Pseudomonas purpurea]|uniref:hypothetical protein n=1 Tax=Pseudomonas purpurea TaxID=3136737 RepID=UPI003262FDE3